MKLRKTLVAELRKTWVSQKRNRAIFREMTFANDCANCCFFAQNWCANKGKFCVSFRKNCAKVLRMETLNCEQIKWLGMERRRAELRKVYNIKHYWNFKRDQRDFLSMSHPLYNLHCTALQLYCLATMQFSPVVSRFTRFTFICFLHIGEKLAKFLW